MVINHHFHISKVIRWGQHKELLSQLLWRWEKENLKLKWHISEERVAHRSISSNNYTKHKCQCKKLTILRSQEMAIAAKLKLIL